MALQFFTSRRGFIGFLVRILGSDGETRAGVIPAFVQTDSAGVEKGTSASPTATTRAQNTEATTTKTLVAATAQTILTAGTYYGVRVLNWTASPVYVTPGITGTPNSTAPSDYIPAAAAGVPGQWEPPYAPNMGLRAVGASAGDLSVITY